MSVIINKQTDNVYISNLKATVDTPNGVFVTPSYENGTATPVADSAAGDKAGLLLVCNVNTYIDQELVADSDFVVKKDKFLRTRAVKVGDTFTTDQFSESYASINKDAVLAVGTGGKLVAIGAREPVISVKVVDKVSLYGKDALKVVVETA